MESAGSDSDQIDTDSAGRIEVSTWAPDCYHQ